MVASGFSTPEATILSDQIYSLSRLHRTWAGDAMDPDVLVERTYSTLALFLG
jgi:hypothetical protein